MADEQGESGQGTPPLPDGWSLRAKLTQGHLEDFYDELPKPPESGSNIFEMARRYLLSAIDADWFNAMPDGFEYRDADPEDIQVLFENIQGRILKARRLDPN